MPEARSLSSLKAPFLLFEAAATSEYAYLARPVVVGVKDDDAQGFVTRAELKACVIEHRYENAFPSDITERASHALAEAGIVRAGRDTGFTPRVG